MRTVAKMALRRIVCIGSILLGVSMMGCDLGEDAETALYDVSGSWSYVDSGSQQSTWALVQNEDGYITGAGTDGETISGTLSSDAIHLALTYSDSTTSTLNGTTDADLMSGTFTNSLAESGTWTALRTN